ncbi:MAG: hypothetical protein DHS80DRAFT_19035 [Piptocephalis tieghemiana]|nr:MAG: hypothetical protein DHS80DRAFT_19035 [Piptocephalis tieghemiana]
MHAILARTALHRTTLAPRTVTQTVSRRGMHFSNENGQNLPFSTKSKPLFALKFISYCALGYSLPFIAGYWQLSKGGA